MKPAHRRHGRPWRRYASRRGVFPSRACDMRLAVRSPTASSSPRSASGVHGEILACQSPSQRQMFPMPATTRWSSKASPIGCRWSMRRRLATITAPSSSAARMSGTEPRDTARRRLENRASTQHRLRPLSRQHEPRQPAHGSSTAIVRQLPDMPRWLRRTRPPSKRRRRFFPWASTASEPLGNAGRAGARMHGFNRQALADERAQPTGRAVDGVALRHTPSRPEDSPARPCHETGLEQERHGCRLGDGLAVEALDRESATAALPRLLHEGSQRDPQPLVFRLP